MLRLFSIKYSFCRKLNTDKMFDKINRKNVPKKSQLNDKRTSCYVYTGLIEYESLFNFAILLVFYRIVLCWQTVFEEE